MQTRANGRAAGAAPGKARTPCGSRVKDLGSARALRAIAKLGELEQRVIVWRFGLFGQPELSIREIAARLNMPAGAVRMLERRALASLGGELGGMEVAA